jgi:hypothetical protein
MGGAFYQVQTPLVAVHFGRGDQGPDKMPYLPWFYHASSVSSVVCDDGTGTAGVRRPSGELHNVLES